MSVSKETKEFIQFGAMLARLRSEYGNEIFVGKVGGPLHSALVDAIKHYLVYKDYSNIGRILEITPPPARAAAECGHPI